METFSGFVTNAAAWTNAPGFDMGSATWPYPHPAASYFFAGFILAFGSGLFCVGITWVRRLIGGSGGEQ